MLCTIAEVDFSKPALATRLDSEHRPALECSLGLPEIDAAGPSFATVTHTAVQEVACFRRHKLV